MKIISGRELKTAENLVIDAWVLRPRVRGAGGMVGLSRREIGNGGGPGVPEMCV